MQMKEPWAMYAEDILGAEFHARGPCGPYTAGPFVVEDHLSKKEQKRLSAEYEYQREHVLQLNITHYQGLYAEACAKARRVEWLKHEMAKPIISEGE